MIDEDVAYLSPRTDLMYLRIADRWYFLVTVIDAYSRSVVHWELLTSMTAADVPLVIQATNLSITAHTPPALRTAFAAVDQAIDKLVAEARLAA